MRDYRRSSNKAYTPPWWFDLIHWLLRKPQWTLKQYERQPPYFVSKRGRWVLVYSREHCTATYNEGGHHLTLMLSSKHGFRLWFGPYVRGRLLFEWEIAR